MCNQNCSKSKRVKQLDLNKFLWKDLFWTFARCCPTSATPVYWNVPTATVALPTQHPIYITLFYSAEISQLINQLKSGYRTRAHFYWWLHAEHWEQVFRNGLKHVVSRHTSRQHSDGNDEEMETGVYEWATRNFARIYSRWSLLTTAFSSNGSALKFVRFTSRVPPL